MARGRRRRKSRKRILVAYLLRTICILILIGLITGMVFLVKHFTKNISFEKKETFAENTIEINKKGQVIGDIYEDFSESYYVESELSEMINDEIEDYNKLTGNASAVKLKDYSVNEGKAIVSIEYLDSEEYRGFNGKELYVGKVSDLQDKGIVFDKNLISVSDSTTFISSTDINSISDYNAIVTEENVMIICPSKILYYTSNVDLQNKTSGRAKTEGGYAVVIYK